MGVVKKLVALAGLLLLAGAVEPLGAADSADVKQIMGENFQAMQVLLVGLLKAQYEGVPEKMDAVRLHAEDLIRNIPASVPENQRRTFTTFAFNLEYKTANLIAVLKELIVRDQKRPDPSSLNVD